jgi:hypothetical protein
MAKAKFKTDTNKDKKPSKKDSEIISFPLRWRVPDDLSTIYSNHIIITHVGGEFYLYYGEAPSPPALKREDFPEEITCFARARIVVSPERLETFLKVMNENLQNFKKNRPEILKQEKKDNE